MIPSALLRSRALWSITSVDCVQLIVNAAALTCLIVPPTAARCLQAFYHLVIQRDISVHLWVDLGQHLEQLYHQPRAHTEVFVITAFLPLLSHNQDWERLEISGQPLAKILHILQRRWQSRRCW